MKTTFKILTNKYLISIIVLSIWVGFFDKNDLLTQLDFSKQLNELEKERQYYLLEIESNKNKLVELQTNSTNLEKFAREQYLMRKEGEDVFVVVHDSAVSIN
jgi:cell division protein FtsB